jgi:prevent-host-death family protein
MAKSRTSESSTVNVAEAKAKLSALLDRAAGGEEIVISRSGKPIARLSPLPRVEPRKPGLLKHLWPHPIPYKLFAPMSGEELAWIEGKFDAPDGGPMTIRQVAQRRRQLGFAADKPKGERKPIRTKAKA